MPEQPQAAPEPRAPLPPKAPKEVVIVIDDPRTGRAHLEIDGKRVTDPDRPSPAVSPSPAGQEAQS